MVPDRITASAEDGFAFAEGPRQRHGIALMIAEATQTFQFDKVEDVISDIAAGRHGYCDG